jgi:surface polysaccharide O-acyltransferase-like enzyme
MASTNRLATESNMDLYRICTMLFVVGHHFLGYIPLDRISNPLNFDAIYFLKHMFVVSVDCFILMSGYFLPMSSFKLSKAVNLLLKTSLYSVILFTIFSNLGYGDKFSIPMFIKSFIPLRGWWFMFPYFILFLLSSFINKAILQLSRYKFFALLVLLFITEVVWPTLVPGSAIDVQRGYSLYNFIYLYLIGAYFRKYPVKVRASVLMTLFLALIAISTIANYMLVYKYNRFDSFDIADRFFNYDFILVSVPAILFFLFFTKIKLNVKWLALLRPHILAVYLIHKQVNFEPFLFNRVFRVGAYTGNLLIFHLLFFMFSIFTLCVAIDYVLSMVFNKAIALISGKAEKLITGGLEKFYKSAITVSN